MTSLLAHPGFAATNLPASGSCGLVGLALRLSNALTSSTEPGGDMEIVEMAFSLTPSTIGAARAGRMRAAFPYALTLAIHEAAPR